MTITSAAIIGGIGLLAIMAMLVGAVVGLGRAKRRAWDDDTTSSRSSSQS